MSQEIYVENIANLFVAIKHCLENKLFMPGLILLYSGIDIFAWSNSATQFMSRCLNFSVSGIIHTGRIFIAHPGIKTAMGRARRLLGKKKDFTWLR